MAAIPPGSGTTGVASGSQAASTTGLEVPGSAEAGAAALAFAAEASDTTQDHVADGPTLAQRALWYFSIGLFSGDRPPGAGPRWGRMLMARQLGPCGMAAVGPAARGMGTAPC